MIDLDRFKPVNDRYGYAAGDRLLRAVADRLVAAVQENDLVARFGGDEFAALLRGVRRPEGAEETAARIVRGLQEPYDLAGTVVEIGGSVGVAVTDGTAPSAEVLLEWADRALYAVKRSGRNDFALYRPGMEQGGE